jgi:hypothetical protein
MSQAEYNRVTRIDDRVKALEASIAELRGIVVDLQNQINALRKTAMTSGKAKTTAFSPAHGRDLAAGQHDGDC